MEDAVTGTFFTRQTGRQADRQSIQSWRARCREVQRRRATCIYQSVCEAPVACVTQVPCQPEPEQTQKRRSVVSGPSAPSPTPFGRQPDQCGDA